LSPFGRLEQISPHQPFVLPAVHILGLVESVTFYVFTDNQTFSLGIVCPEKLLANIDAKSTFLLERDQFCPKLQVQGVSPPTIFLVAKLECLYFLRGKNFARSFFRFVTIHAFIGQTDILSTDGRTDKRLHPG